MAHEGDLSSHARDTYDASRALIQAAFAIDRALESRILSQRQAALADAQNALNALMQLTDEDESEMAQALEWPLPWAAYTGRRA